MFVYGEGDNFEKGNTHLCLLVLICLFINKQAKILSPIIPPQKFTVDLMITWHIACTVKLN